MNSLTLQQEVAILRSAVIGLIGEDLEGKYRPEFVKEMFAALSDVPKFTFTTPKQFLKHLKSGTKKS